MSKGQDPTRQQRVRLANVMENRAICEVSSRWLQFSESATLVGGEPLLFVDVMTLNSDDQEKKICQLVLSKDELQLILGRVAVKN
jgi:hypothetical protein